MGGIGGIGLPGGQSLGTPRGQVVGVVVGIVVVELGGFAGATVDVGVPDRVVGSSWAVVGEDSLSAGGEPVCGREVGVDPSPSGFATVVVVAAGAEALLVRADATVRFVEPAPAGVLSCVTTT